MAEIYTTGTWEPNSGAEEAFVEAWAEFAAWASRMPGAGTLRLTRDRRDGRRFLSFGAWRSDEAVRAWKSAPEFQERLARVLQHVDEFHSAELGVVTVAESGRITSAAADVGADHVTSL